MATRKPLGKKIRFEVFKRDKFTCQYCGRKAPEVVLEVDHIKPVADGGTDEMLNLVTACFDCNRGKGKRELSDDSIVVTQQKQLEELAERKEQMEMLIAWKRELMNMNEEFVDLLCEHFESFFDGAITVNELGRKDFSKWIKEFGFQEVLEAMEISVDKYCKSNNRNDIQNAFNKIGGICAMRKKQKNDPQLYYFNYSKKVLKEKCNYINMPVLHEYIYENVFTEEDFERLKSIFYKANNWSAFSRIFEKEFGIDEC